MEYYGVNDFRSYKLMHFGIQGMKWGVRRYQNPDGSLTSAGRARYGYGQKIVNAYSKTSKGRENLSKAKALGERIQKARESEGIATKASYMLGNRGKSINAKHQSKFEKGEAERAKTRLGKAWREQRSKNFAEAEKYYDVKANRDIGERIVASTIIDTDLWNTPYHRLSGRETTYGKEAVSRMFTGGLAGLALDAKYMSDKKKKTGE